MTSQPPTSSGSAARRGFSFKPYLLSLLCHAGVIGVVVGVATLNVRNRPEVIEVEIVEIAPPPAEAALLPPLAEPIEALAPPELAQIRKVETRARPYSPAAAAVNQLRREPLAEPNRLPALPSAFALAMEATVQGGPGIEVVAVAAADANVLADPSKPGWPGLAADGGGLLNEVYADAWEITVEPDPINDRDFKPVYPADARSRHLEAAVEVELLIDSTGAVADTRVLETGGDQFSLSALEYCGRLRFKPALANQMPVASRIVWVVTYRFGNR